MASSPMSLYSGSRSVPARTSGAAAPVRQLLTRLRSSLRRRSVSRPRRAEATSFAYDLRSYSQNFDDGLGSSNNHL